MANGRLELAGPLLLSAIFYIRRPASHLRAQGGILTRFRDALPAGDTDNLAKAVMDALTSCAYGDDRQIVSLFAARRWGEQEQALIELRRQRMLGGT
jgi:Holliday junction resolvase RusA-like endonuclease